MKYSILIRLLHWLMALIILSLIALGYYMSELPKDSPNRMDYYNLHKEFGFLILILFFVRLITRNILKTPRMPKEIKQPERKLAKIGHYCLYALMFCVPFAGVYFSNAHGYGIHFFGLDIMPFFSKNKSNAALAGDLHAFLAYTLLVLVALHAGAVLKHYLIDKVNLLKRIV